MKDDIWKLYRTDYPYFHEKMYEVLDMKRYCYEADHEGRIATLGVYEYRSEQVLKAWGYKDQEHCSYHAIKTNGIWSEIIEGCPDFKVLQRGFSISHKKLHIWEGGVYREEDISKACCATEVKVCHITEKEESLFEKLDLYAPLIFIALLSLVVGWLITSFQVFTVEVLLMNAMGVFITTLGLLKLKDISAFADMFKRYDPLAQQVPLYAKLYPILETGIGLLVLSGLFMIPVQTIVVIMYSCTTFGIIISLSSGKSLECGCLGGGTKLPLSKVTVFENMTMIAMALFAIYNHS